MTTAYGRFALMVALSFWTFASHPACAEQNTTAKILLIGKAPDHPWGTHMYMHTNAMLAKCLKNTDGVETIVSEGWPEDPKARTSLSVGRTNVPRTVELTRRRLGTFIATSNSKHSGVRS